MKGNILSLLDDMELAQCHPFKRGLHHANQVGPCSATPEESVTWPASVAHATWRAAICFRGVASERVACDMFIDGALYVSVVRLGTVADAKG